MIRTLRIYFLRRLFREKLLVVGFLGLAVVLWASGFASRTRRFSQDVTDTTAKLANQDYWLGQQQQIRAATEKAASQMDPGKTLDLTGLSVTVTQLASDAGVQVNTPAGTAPMRSGPFSINRLRVQVPSSDWGAFAKFYASIQERAPYIAVTDMSMQPAQGNPAKVAATMGLASFEIAH